MQKKSNYRYPGSHPFQDKSIDRKLFFGRDHEKQVLLHKILSEDLVLLFAKSGIGKTSLLNAGVLKQLRRRDFLPFMIRFNNPAIEPTEMVYQGIRNIVAAHEVEYIVGKEKTLWQYFKTAEFWSSSDILMTPILIFDQFEELFTLYPADKRKDFIKQLADLIRGTLPEDLGETEDTPVLSLYSENPPNLKIVISIREDFLGELEGFSGEIPSILQNRYRLLPLTRKQAKKAIENPAGLEGEEFGTGTFRYEENAVDDILDYLCKRKIKKEIVVADEVEPSQLQLLCQYVESLVLEKSRKDEKKQIIIKTSDLGGEAGMLKILQSFYDNQVKRLGFGLKRKQKIRKLFEKGLISITDRRISLEEEQIEQNYNISKELLAKLVNNRLLRSEPRVGSVYYELSHDTLIQPIRESQRERNRKKRIVGGFVFIILLVLLSSLLMNYRQLGEPQSSYVEASAMRVSARYEEAEKKYQEIIRKDKNFVKAYIDLGQIYSDTGRAEEESQIYRQAIANNIKNPVIYYQYGKVLKSQGSEDEAVKNFEEAIKIDPSLSIAFKELGNLYRRKKEYEKAVKSYEKALTLDKQDVDIYKGLATLYIEQGNDQKAISIFKNAIAMNKSSVTIYYDLAEEFKRINKSNLAKEIYSLALNVESKDKLLYYDLSYYLIELNEYDKAIEALHKSLKLDPKYADAINALGVVYYNQKKYPKAIAYYRKAIELDPKHRHAYRNLGLVYQKEGKYDEAIEIYQKALAIDPGDAEAYNDLGVVYDLQEKYPEAIASYRKAIELDPKHRHAYRTLGLVYQKEGKYDEAIEIYQKALAIDPGDADLYNSLGFIYHEKKFDFEKAFQMFSKSYKINPEDISTKANLAEANLTNRQFTKAFSIANELLAKKDIPNKYRVAMRFVTTSSLLLQKNESEAKIELKEFVSYYKSLPEDFQMDWSFAGIESFIQSYKEIDKRKYDLLIEIIKILKSTKSESREELKKLENFI